MKRFVTLFAGFALLLVVANTASAQTRMTTSTVRALYAALDDERKAEAQYRAVVQKFHFAGPFAQIMLAEGKHAQALIRVMERHQLRVPPNQYRWEQFTVPETLAECCQEAVKAEEASIRMYRYFLTFVTQPDVQNVFTNLMNASKDQHLPAFKKCACNNNCDGGDGTQIQQRDRDRTNWE